MNNNGLLWRGSWIAVLHTAVWASATTLGAAALADHLRLLAASPEIAARPPSFRDLLAKSQSIAQRLEDQLSTVPSGDPARLSADMQALQATCKECHASARNQRPAPGRAKSELPLAPPQ